MAIALTPRYPVNTPPKLEHINADTLTDVQGDGFYLIRIQVIMIIRAPQHH